MKKETTTAANVAKAKEMRMKIETIRKNINARKCRSAWDRGVNMYASELLDKIAEEVKYCEECGDQIPEISQTFLLNGAKYWRQYSGGGCSLICDEDIAERLCTPSELKRVRGGLRQPNSREDWLDVQARALHQAAYIIMEEFRKIN